MNRKSLSNFFDFKYIKSVKQRLQSTAANVKTVRNEQENTKQKNGHMHKDSETKNDDQVTDDKNDIYSIANIQEIQQKVKKLKEHPKFKIMQQRGIVLLDAELIALVYYTDSWLACRKMKDYHRAKSNIQEHKELYFHATNGIAKLYRVFHYKNPDQPKISQLYHGSTIPELDGLSQEQRFLKTLWSFSTRFSVASEEFGTGSVWVMDDVYSALYSGQLKAADVSWISGWPEAEVIIMPTTFYEWRLMSKQEIQQNNWKVSSNIKVYITNQYISNLNYRCIHGDTSLLSKTPNYHDLEYSDIKKWFMDNFIGWKEQIKMKCYNIFIENGCQSLDDIVSIKGEKDLIDIGIKMKFERLRILNEVNKLKESMSSQK